MCPTDLLIPYSSMLDLDDQTLHNLLCPFLEPIIIKGHLIIKHLALTSSLLKPEFNRSEDALNASSRAFIQPLLLEICQHAYHSITQASNQMTCFKEQFIVLPRSVLECAVRDQLLPEA